MSKGFGIFRKMLMNIKDTAKASAISSAEIGSDHLGNRYFEKVYPNKRRPSRWVEAEDKDQFRAPEVPAEWDAWLRLKRKHPPTQEEIDKNYGLMLRTLKRAAELEGKDKEVRLTNSEDNKSELTASVQPNENEQSFPVYDDLEVKPGTKR